MKPVSKVRSVAILVAAQVAGMGLWFVSAAILGDILIEAQLQGELVPTGMQALMSTMVQAGFVVGAVLSAIFGLADRVDPRRFFAVSAIFAAGANLCLLWIPATGWGAVFLRFLTGFALAGVYPVGLKLAAGWGERDRGLLVGLLVAALTLGSAMPHLFAFLGGADWKLTLVISSVVAAVGGVSILFTDIGPYHTKAAAFNPNVIYEIWHNRPIRGAFLGYLGHMWEVYAMWAWLGAAVTAGLTARMGLDMLPPPLVSEIKLLVFSVIAVGAAGCVFGGWFADRLGKANIAVWAMVISLGAGVATAFSLGGPLWLTGILALIWGLSVIPDSPQFSAIIADNAKPEATGSLLSFQTASGFLLTVLTVQGTPFVAEFIGWQMTFLLIGLGPLFGIISMLRYRNS